MSRKSNPIKTILVVFLWVAAAGFWLAPGTIAAESGGGIRKITSMGETKSYQQQAHFRAEAYFDVIGILNLIESDRVVIGDRELSLAPGVKNSRARQYDLVGAKLNNTGAAVVIDVISNEPN
jgi:hypothetical protein